MDTDDELFICNAVNEERVVCRYGEAPVYVPVLRAMIPVGHYVIVSVGEGRSVVCQIIGRVEGADQLVEVLPFIPLYSREANDYFSSPITALPRALTESTCADVIEVFRTSSIATVRASVISNVAFIFLADHVRSHLFNIHGISNAFLVRFKYSLDNHALAPLDSNSFHCFPDMSIQYQQFWSDCFARTIYNAIDHLRQEIWRFLCRYGASQGIFPKQTVNLYFPTAFTNYLSNYLQLSGVRHEECAIGEPQRKVDVNFLYRMVSPKFVYRYFRLDSADHMQCITNLIGTMSIFGVRKRMPRKDTEVVIRNFDLVNVIKCMEFLIHASKVKLRLYAFRHQIGDETSCPWLIPHLTAAAPAQQPVEDLVMTRQSYTVRLKSKFDFMGSIYEVVEELCYGHIRTVCKWGDLRGEEKVFTKEDVIRYVNLKRGINNRL